jgi:Arc/MetJ-type ribon-helix-helix transcriptional regulator
MKVSVSLPDEVVAFVDQYAEAHSEESRSAVVRRALKLLRQAELVEEYKQALIEWEESGEEAIWDQATGDGLEKSRDETW